MAFVSDKQIRFHHCDPAGIVFYPQYFVLMNELVEDWFDRRLCVPFAELHQRDRRPERGDSGIFRERRATGEHDEAPLTCRRKRRQLEVERLRRIGCRLHLAARNAPRKLQALEPTLVGRQ